jgi:hypothetical protein
MEHGPGIVVQRSPYEEPYNTQLRIDASNGKYSGRIEIYCDVGRLREIGLALVKFPSKVPDEYVFEYGSEAPKDRWAYYLKFRAYTVGMRGQPALQFSMNLNQDVPDDGRSSFSIAAVEPAALARLGHLFLRLESHPTGGFRWTPSDDEFRTDEDGEPA